MIEWSDLRTAAADVGLAVARRLYPTARPNGRIFDLALPDAVPVEAKAARFGGRVRVTESQLKTFKSGVYGRVVVSIYDRDVAYTVPRGASTFAAVARAVRIVVDVPAADIVSLHTTYGEVRALTLARLAVFPNRSEAKAPIVRLDIRGPGNVRGCVSWASLIVVAPGPTAPDMRTWRVRRGLDRTVPF